MTEQKFQERYDKAKKHVASMDRIERYKDRAIGTIIEALKAGLKYPESNAQFDALVMLIDVQEDLQKERGANC